MIIGLTGSIAAGKETLNGFLKEKGFIYMESSKLLKEELIKRNLEITRKNMQDLGDELRKKFGGGVLMKMFLERIDKDKNYVIDSLRNPLEAEFLRKNTTDFVLIAVDAPQKIRFERILKRGKASDPRVWEEFLITDNRDQFDKDNALGQRVRECIKTADYVLYNDMDLESFNNKIQEMWKSIEKKV